MESRNTSESSTWSSKTAELTYMFRFPFPIAEFIINTQPEPKFIEKLLVYSIATVASTIGICFFVPMTSITIPMDLRDLVNERNKKLTHRFFSKETEIPSLSDESDCKAKPNLS